MPSLYKIIKRCLDLAAVVALAILFFPFFAIIAVLIKIKLGGPIIFKQVRLGLNSLPFCIYKFRTMTDDCDQNGRLLPDDMRLTKFGKILREWSLDELPQLYNVLKGELSLVGPRPLLAEQVSFYSADQERRQHVVPGITGWAQVNGRNSLNWDEKMKLDLWYVDNASLLLDMKIMLLTIIKVLKRENVPYPPDATKNAE